MTKSELVKEISTQSGESVDTSSRVLDAIMSSVTKALANNNRVTLVGFGTFEVRDRNAREGRNPKTGETIKIAASKSPAFKAGKSLKESVNQEPKKTDPKKKVVEKVGAMPIKKKAVAKKIKAQ